MPRPRKNQEGPSAVERIEEAFWSLLAEKPYAKISVGEVARKAKINKNAFYYHFENLDDLARIALGNAWPTDLLLAVLRGFMGADTSLALLVADPENLERFDRLCLVAGRHSTPALQEALKEAMRGAWRDVLGVRTEAFGTDSQLMTEFVFGGLLSLLAYRAEHMPDMTLQELFESGIVSRLRQTLPPLVLTTLHKDGALSESSLLKTSGAEASSSIFGDGADEKVAS